MKTKNIPSLTKIKVVKRLSEETPCFTATLDYRGISYSVSNRGTGGCNDYHPHLSRETEAELDAWCAANNPPCMMEGFPPFPMSFETWTFGKAFGL
jgi:hypothetical protein